jgi:hypothetical protein
VNHSCLSICDTVSCDNTSDLPTITATRRYVALFQRTTVETLSHRSVITNYAYNSLLSDMEKNPFH